MTIRSSLIAAVAMACVSAALMGCSPTGSAPSAPQAKAGAAVAAANDPKAIVESAADPCLEAKGLFLTALCGHPELKDFTAQVKTTILSEGQSLDRQSAEVLRDGQKSWIAATRNYCNVDDAAGVLSPEQLQCVKSALQLRVRQAADMVQEKGGLQFLRVELNDASKPVAAAASDGMSPGADLSVTKNVDYPQISGDTPAARGFNALMRDAVAQLRPPPNQDASQTSEAIDYDIAYAGPDLVSVVFTATQSTPGAMHSENATRVVNVLMASGKELTAADVFAPPETRWSGVLVQKAMAGLRRQLRDLRGVEISQDDVRDTVTKPHNWRVTDTALVLVIPPNSVGPSTLGTIQVQAPWSELKALVREDAPAPIRPAPQR